MSRQNIISKGTTFPRGVWKSVFPHLFGITLVISYQVVTILIYGMNVTIKGWYSFVLQILTFYANFFWVVPLLEKKRNIFRIILGLALLLTCHFLLRAIIVFGWPWEKGFSQFLITPIQLASASMQVIWILALSFLIGLFKLDRLKRKLIFEKEQLAQEAIQEKLRIECTMSQLQLSPHYLFNSLNYIKVNSEQPIPDVAKVTDLLADILRHTLIDISNIRLVPLASEIDLVQKHIQLHEQLSSVKPWIEYIDTSNSQNSNLEIPPSILLTLTENVLKYAVLNDPDIPARIEITRDQTVFRFYTFNYKRAYPLPGRGRGLNSIRSILSYYYPEQHTLDINENEEWFKLTLTLKL